MMRQGIGALSLVAICSFGYFTSKGTPSEDVRPAAPVVATEDPADLRAMQDIEGQMRTIKSLLETLTTKIEDPKEKKTVLEAFTKLEQAFMTCKDITPPKAGNVKEAEKDAFVAEYRRFQIDAVKLTLDAEKKFLEGKAKDAKKMVRDVEALKGKGHGKYK